MNRVLPALLAVIFFVRPLRAETGVTENEIVIGSCSVLEGPNGELGREFTRGGNAYFQYINAQGGVWGRKIRLVALNDDYDPDKAIECFNKLIDARIFAGAFFVGTPTAAKYVTMAERNKIPIAGFSTGAGFLYEPVKRYVFTARASYADEIKGLVGHLWMNAGVRRIALIYQNDAAGAASLDGLKQALREHGAVPAAMASYARNTLEVEKALAAVREANPEAVLLLGPTEPITEIIKRARRSRWNPIFVTTQWTDSYVKAAGPAGEGVISTQVMPLPSRRELPTVRLFQEAASKYIPDRKAGLQQMRGFVEALVFVEGLKRAGRKLTREKFVDALESLHHFDTGLGAQFQLNYGPTRHQGFDAVAFTVQSGETMTEFKDWNSLRRAENGHE